MTWKSKMLSFFVLLVLFISTVSGAEGQQLSNNATENRTVDVLVKIHGAGMIAAWGIIIPLAMSVALMCKSVCPGKAYVYSHMTLMLLALLVVVVSLVLIIIHADGKWINSFAPLSNPHKIMGIIAFAVLVINPFLAIVTPPEDSKWRSLYKAAHGGSGFFIGLLSAMAAMLIAVHFLPSMAKDIDRAKLIIILMSALVGYIILLLAVYNIYPIRYHKSIPQPYKIKGIVKRYCDNNGIAIEDHEIPMDSSPDSTYRAVAMTVTLTPLFVLGIATIVYLVILN